MNTFFFCGSLIVIKALFWQPVITHWSTMDRAKAHSFQRLINRWRWFLTYVLDTGNWIVSQQSSSRQFGISRMSRPSKCFSFLRIQKPLTLTFISVRLLRFLVVSATLSPPEHFNKQWRCNQEMCVLYLRTPQTGKTGCLWQRVH